jgi:hypothetical protein
VALSDSDLEHLRRCVELAPSPPVAALPTTTVAPGIVVDRPAPEPTDAMHTLYRKKFGS